MTEVITFSKALKKLKDVVEKLNKGDLELEESLRLYEEGAKLHKECLKKLNQTKLKFKEIDKKGNVISDHLLGDS
ncbi:MAG: exodeoxyribonuclease VII small subunit [Patescibacteria group bacterium]